MLIFVFQSMVGDAMQQVHNVAAGANAGVDDLHPWLRNRRAEFTLQHLFYAGTHKIHNLLGRVDNTIRICSLHRVALEKALINGIQEMLPL